MEISINNFISIDNFLENFISVGKFTGKFRLYKRNPGTFISIFFF